MARTETTITKITDDLTGEELTEDDVVTIEFSYGGQEYTIDLNKANAKALDDFMATYVDAATPIRKAPRKAPAKIVGKSGGTPAEDFGKFDRAEVTKWARENGFTVSDRGRISYEVLRAFFHH